VHDSCDTIAVIQDEGGWELFSAERMDERRNGIVGDYSLPLLRGLRLGSRNPLENVTTISVFVGDGLSPAFHRPDAERIWLDVRYVIKGEDLIWKLQKSNYTEVE